MDESGRMRLLEFQLDIDQLAPNADVTVDADGNFMLLPQGFVVMDGYFSQNFSLDDQGAANYLCRIGTILEVEKYIPGFNLAKKPDLPVRGLSFALDARYGDPRPTATSSPLRFLNASTLTIQSADGPVIGTIHVVGFLRH